MHFTRTARVDWVFTVNRVTVNLKIEHVGVLSVDCISAQSRHGVPVDLITSAVGTKVEPHTKVRTILHIVVAHRHTLCTDLGRRRVGWRYCIEVVRDKHTNTTIDERVALDHDIVVSRGLDAHVIVVNRTTAVGDVG